MAGWEFCVFFIQLSQSESQLGELELGFLYGTLLSDYTKYLLRVEKLRKIQEICSYVMT
jgi:hypothetical protein